MSMSDPIADMLTRIRNAQMMDKVSVRMPASKLKKAIAKVLKDEGYIEDFAVRDAQGLPEYFGAMWYRVAFTPPQASGNLALHVYKADRKVTVYVDGKQANAEPVEAFRGVTVDLAGLLKPGQAHQIAVRVDHVPLPELFLGGIAGPIYLIEKAP